MSSASIILIMALAMLLPQTALALPGPHDPTSGRPYTCRSCHTAGATLGAQSWNNVCTVCHSGMADPIGGGAAPIKKFGEADFANPFGTYGGARPAVLYQTSHKWTGTDTVPLAGALPPLDTTYMGMNKYTLAGSITCARCHNVHGNSGPQSSVSPFLRAANDKDQMCLDCHRPRNSQSHVVGSHPVAVSYSSALKRRPTQFKADSATPTIPPINPANRTAEMKIKSGLVLCSTCHGVHFTDSNSRTYDNHSSALSNVIRPSGFGGLSTSKGFLLRTDMFGATATTVNICTNCHNKPNHKKRGQNIQCADCHAGHVDTADGTVPNVYVIRRYMNISTSKGAVRNSPSFYQYTGSNRNWKNGDASKPGVCQACHVVPTGGSYPSEHNDTSGANGKLCMGCHVHDATDGAFSASCTNCHGYPPSTNTAGATTGYAFTASYNYASQTFFKDESKTPHTVHAGGAPYTFGCTECHNGNSHNTGTFQDVFKVASVTLVSNGQGTTPAYTPNNPTGPGTCATYCHSNGKPAIGAYVTKAPVWANGKGTIIGTLGECTACHDNATGFTGTAHVKHVNTISGKGYTCATCHAATVSGSTTIISTAKHVNGQKDISFSGSVGANALTGTCSTVYCHGNGKGAPAEISPTFAVLNSGQCGGCHKVSPGIASGRPLINSNAHFAHMSSIYGPKSYLQPGATATSCEKCHTYTGELASTHVNGAVEVVSAAGSACRTCHPNGAAVPVWSGGRVTCESCHTGTPSVINSIAAPTKPNFTVSGHGQANVNYSASQLCSNCHDPNSAHISNALGTYKRIATNNNTLCFGCHNNAAKVTTVTKQNMPAHVIDKTLAEESNPTMDCKLCHDVHGTSNIKMVKTTIVFGALTSTITYGSSNDLVRLTPPYRGVCQTCHTKTTHYKRNVNEGTSHPTTGCLNCHTHKGAAYAFKPKACDACHGYPPAPKGFVSTQASYSTAKLENYSGGGGAHVKAGHILANVRPSQGFAPCVVCHNDGGSAHVGRTAIFNPMTSPTTAQKKANTTVRVDANYKFNSSKPLDSSQYRKATPGNTGSCWNVSCHFQPTPRWSVDK